jgi:hypothetical protein
MNCDSFDLNRRKQQIRDLWCYRQRDHIPIWLTVSSNPWNYSVQEQFRFPEKQLAVQLAGIERTLSLVPDDVIPLLQPSIASSNENAVALGANLYWADDVEQSPTVAAPVVSSAADVQALARASWRANPLISTWFDRVSFFARESEWPLSLNLNGPTDAAFSISDGVWFCETMVTDPEVIRLLYRTASEATISVAELAIRAAGRERVTLVGGRLWCPEGCAGYVSDDVATFVSPAHFESLNRPANDHIFERYGPGVMHVCGPHPSAELYFGGQHPPSAFTASWQYTVDFLPRLQSALAGKGVLYLELTDYETWHDRDYSVLVARYQKAVDCFAPSALVVAYLQVGEEVDAAGLYSELRTISEQYASRMDWSIYAPV